MSRTMEQYIDEISTYLATEIINESKQHKILYSDILVSVNNIVIAMREAEKKSLVAVKYDTSPRNCFNCTHFDLESEGCLFITNNSSKYINFRTFNCAIYYPHSLES